MLCLTRRKFERLMIGENIVIEIMEIAGDKVKLGITAPPDVNIVREELTHRESHGPARSATDGH